MKTSITQKDKDYLTISINKLTLKVLGVLILIAICIVLACVILDAMMNKYVTKEDYWEGYEQGSTATVDSIMDWIDNAPCGDYLTLTNSTGSEVTFRTRECTPYTFGAGTFTVNPNFLTGNIIQGNITR